MRVEEKEQLAKQVESQGCGQSWKTSAERLKEETGSGQLTSKMLNNQGKQGWI